MMEWLWSIRQNIQSSLMTSIMSTAPMKVRNGRRLIQIRLWMKLKKKNKRKNCNNWLTLRTVSKQEKRMFIDRQCSLNYYSHLGIRSKWRSWKSRKKKNWPSHEKVSYKDYSNASLLKHLNCQNKTVVQLSLHSSAQGEVKVQTQPLAVMKNRTLKIHSRITVNNSDHRFIC